MTPLADVKSTMLLMRSSVALARPMLAPKAAQRAVVAEGDKDAAVGKLCADPTGARKLSVAMRGLVAAVGRGDAAVAREGEGTPAGADGREGPSGREAEIGLAVALAVAGRAAA